MKGIKEFLGMKSNLLPLFLRSIPVFKKDLGPGSGYMSCGAWVRNGHGMDRNQSIRSKETLAWHWSLFNVWVRNVH